MEHHEKHLLLQYQNQLLSAEELSDLKKNQGALDAQLDGTRARIRELEDNIKKNNNRKEIEQEELKIVRRDIERLNKELERFTKDFNQQDEEVAEYQMNILNFNQEMFNANAQLASLKENLEMFNLNSNFAAGL